MAFGVFICRPDSIYNDSPDTRYQFPSTYLRRVEACLHDWIVYYEPVKVAKTRGYFAVAKVGRITPDPDAPGMHLALIEAGSYLDFPIPVPFSGPDGLVERSLLNGAGRISGRAQSAVRQVAPADFHRILRLGMFEGVTSLPRIARSKVPLGFQEEQLSLDNYQDRERTTYLTSRAFRDRVFRQVILRAYDSRCAVTGLKLINGGGRAEVEAAHIQPVEHNGPDIVTNGLALSGTAHWMFDRGLIGIADNSQILISRHLNDAAGVLGMINTNGCIFLPDRAADRPSPQFLQWHREKCFKT